MYVWVFPKVGVPWNHPKFDYLNIETHEFRAFQGKMPIHDLMIYGVRKQMTTHLRSESIFRRQGLNGSSKMQPCRWNSGTDSRRTQAPFHPSSTEDCGLGVKPGRWFPLEYTRAIKLFIVGLVWKCRIPLKYSPKSIGWSSFSLWYDIPLPNGRDSTRFHEVSAAWSSMSVLRMT